MNPFNNLLKGILKGLVYYAAGALLSWITWLVFGWEYKHAPGFHHLVGLLFLLGGAAWFVYYLILLVVGLKHRVNIGAFAMHALVVLCVVGLFFVSFWMENDEPSEAVPETILTITRSDSAGHSLIVDGNNDTLLLMHGDSVIIDKVK